MNEISEIYTHQTFEVGLDGKHLCPICGKKYKKIETLKKHYEEKSCHSAVDIFKDTQTEFLMLNVFVVLCFREKEKSVVSMGSFRKSKYYSRVAEFFVFCRKNNIKSWENYMEYCSQYYNGNMNGFLSYLIKESTLTLYYHWRRGNITEEASTRFLQENFSELKDNFNFLVRSIERGEMTLETAISGIGHLHFVNMSPLERKAIVDLYEV